VSRHGVETLHAKGRKRDCITHLLQEKFRVEKKWVKFHFGRMNAQLELSRDLGGTVGNSKHGERRRGLGKKKTK